MATMMHSTTGPCKLAAKRSTVQPMAMPKLSSCSLRMPKAQAFGSGASVSADAAKPVTRVVRMEATQAAQAPSSSSSQTQEWYGLVASAEFFFDDPQNESLAEQLRERVRFFKEQGKEQDFYFVPEPKWLDAKYPEQAKKVKRPCVALVSTDKNWIIFMKLRLDRVMRFDLGTLPQKEVLAVGGKVPEFPAPAKWTAPYPRYTPGWWEVFFPKA